MNLMKAIAPLLAQGVTLKLILSGNADAVQLDLVPEAKESKAGINLPLTSVVAPAAQMDAELEQFFLTYVAGATRINGIADTASAAIAAAEEEAKTTAATKVAAAKSKTANAPKRPATPAPKGPRTAGLAGDDDSDDDGLDSGDGAGGTTLSTAGTAAPAAAPAAAEESATGNEANAGSKPLALNPDLF